MAHLWYRNEQSTWSALALGERAVDISVYPPQVLAKDFRLGEDALAAVIRAKEGDSRAWALLVAEAGEVRVNGFAPVAGVRVLQDRDELRAASFEPLFFSTETLAHVESLPAAERAVFCARCRQPMTAGEPAVRCPRCAVWYHQTENLPCWTYAAKCALCPQSSSLDAGSFEWVPED